MKVNFSTEIGDKTFIANVRPNRFLTIMNILTYYSVFGQVNDFQETIHFDNDVLEEYFNKNKHKIRFKMISKACSGTRRQKLFAIANEKDEELVDGTHEILLHMVIDALIKSQNPDYIVNNELFEVE